MRHAKRTGNSAERRFHGARFFAIGSPTFSTRLQDICRMSKSADMKARRTARAESHASGDRAQAASAASSAAIDLGPLPQLAGYMLRRAQLAVFQDFWRAYAEYDIRPAVYAVMIVIQRNPGLRQSQVSAALNIKRANLVALLDGLEARGLAKRVPVATDRRSYALHLTEAGQTLMEKLDELNAAHEKRVSAVIGESGRKDLLRLLHGVTEAVGSAPAEEDDS
jgi:DNA-binding MarR family transcriptional regulator